MNINMQQMMQKCGNSGRNMNLGPSMMEANGFWVINYDYTGQKKQTNSYCNMSIKTSTL